MSTLAGLVFDCYDDPDGGVLQSVVPNFEDLPSFVKESRQLQPEDSEVLGDDQFALVLVKEGQKFRKYAMTDKGNTALSVIYLLKQAHLLPPKAVKTAASNLVYACTEHGLDVPEVLKIAAETGVSKVAKETRKGPKIDERAPTQDASDQFVDNPRLGGDTEDEDHRSRTSQKTSEGENFTQIPEGFGNEKTATADDATKALFDNEAVTRQKNWRSSPHVDLEDWEPGAVVEKTASSAPVLTLLRGMYPVDSFDQVKTAVAYFEEYGRDFHPRDRRTYCTKLARRLSGLGQPIPNHIEKYAHASYRDDVDFHVDYRRQFVEDDFHPALDTLIEKRAQVSPDTFAEALCEFDQMTGLQYQWDSNLSDPWLSTFGPTMDKIAESEWEWENQGVYINEEMLDNLATNGGELLQRKFGPDFYKEFRKSPKSFFKALPKPNQLVLARIASDHNSGTGTE